MKKFNLGRIIAVILAIAVVICAISAFVSLFNAIIGNAGAWVQLVVAIVLSILLAVVACKLWFANGGGKKLARIRKRRDGDWHVYAKPAKAGAKAKEVASFSDLTEADAWLKQKGYKRDVLIAADCFGLKPLGGKAGKARSKDKPVTEAEGAAILADLAAMPTTDLAELFTELGINPDVVEDAKDIIEERKLAP